MRTTTTGAALLVAGLLAAGCSGGVEDTAAPADDAAPAQDASAAPGCDSVDLTQPPDEPTTMRIGHGFAAEEPFWLLAVDDELASRKGEWYEMDLQPFRATAERLTAYQAGELDAVVISPQAQIRGAARGALDLYAVVTIMREAEPDAFSTSFVASEGSGITSPADLTGQQIAIVDSGSQLDFLARLGVQQGGGDPERDAEYVTFPFPAQGEALAAGQIDVAGLPEPFYTLAKSSGGVVDVFDAADVTDFAYDLLTVSFDQQFLEDNVGAVCAFVADYGDAMEYWQSSKEEARRTLEPTDFIQIPLDVYLQTGDYARPDGGAVDTEGMASMLDTMIETGILEEADRVDVQTLVRPGVSVGH